MAFEHVRVRVNMCGCGCDVGALIVCLCMSVCMCMIMLRLFCAYARVYVHGHLLTGGHAGLPRHCEKEFRSRGHQSRTGAFELYGYVLVYT